MAADPHAIAAEIAYSRQLVRGNGSDLVPALSRVQERPKPKAKRESKLDTPQVDWSAWEDWADRRADARVAAALEQHDATLGEAIGGFIGEVRSELRGEFSKAVADATRELRGELATLRAEVVALRRELEQERAVRDLYKQLAARGGELARLQDELMTLREDTGPVVRYFNNAR
jgi:hypothetical protein